MVSNAAAPVPQPDHISVQALNAAKGVQLKFWIDEANGAANGKVLTKVGTVQDLRTKLAEYYALDLACPPEKSAGPITRGQEVQKRQFAYLRELWKEWPSGWSVWHRTGRFCSATHLLVSLSPSRS